MRQVLAALVLAAAAMAGAAQSSHAAITFEYDSICIADCATIGLASGDAVSGTISFNDAAILPNGVLSGADVAGFDLDFGIVDISFASAAAFSFTGQLNATASAFTSFLLVAGETIAPVLGDFIFVADNTTFASPLGACHSPCATGVATRPAIGTPD